MLQIITGKFYGDGERIHTECNGILYSNARFYSIKPIEYGNIKINTVDWNTGLPSFVISYDNCIERVHQDNFLVKVGDNVILEQLKNILSFSLDSFFDENEAVVESICRQEKNNEKLISSYVDKTFDMNRHLTVEEWNKSISFYNKMMSLKRDDYIVVMRCLAAYSSSFKVFSNDISLAYSILVYILETLSTNFDNYTTSWNDYEQNKRVKIDKELEKIDVSIAENIRNILITNEHLKLSRRFSEFVFNYVDDDYYNATGKKQITEDEMFQAVSKAYVFRSKYAHKLQPIMKQLSNPNISKNSDLFEWQHEVFFTYSGLLRITRTVLYNFIMSRQNTEEELIDWYSELPGMIDIELHPQNWLGKNIDFQFNSIYKNMSAFLYCFEKEKKVPNLNLLAEHYLNNIMAIKESDRRMAYTLCWIYVNCVSGNDSEYVKNMQKKLLEYQELNDVCDMATLIGKYYGMPTKDFTAEEVILIIDAYNKSKFKNNRLKIPATLENKIYLLIANCYEDDNPEEKKKWLNKAYKNAVNDKELQSCILNMLNEIKV